jgi:hypothetical protein
LVGLPEDERGGGEIEVEGSKLVEIPLRGEEPDRIIGLPVRGCPLAGVLLFEAEPELPLLQDVALSLLLATIALGPFPLEGEDPVCAFAFEPPSDVPPLITVVLPFCGNEWDDVSPPSSSLPNLLPPNRPPRAAVIGTC